MNPFHIVCWVFAFIGYLFIQSFVINGIHASADGDTKILPDGSEKDSEMILYPLQKFLLQYKLKKIFYSGQEFKKMWDLLRHKYINIIPPSVDADALDKLVFTKEEDIETMKKLCYVIERDHEINWMYNNGAFIFYKQYRDYRFSKYIRLPIIQCIKCMSSFWSLVLTFFPVMIFVFGLHWWLLPLWVFNVFALAYLNKALYR